MTYLSDEQLLNLNRLGIIPGPSESLDDFARRADYCLMLKKHLSAPLKDRFGDQGDDHPEVLELANSQLAVLYDVAPSWIPLFFSNYRLPFWHGGCAWIFQETENSPTAALVQLRRSLFHSKSYLGIYHRNELLEHELVHVGRMIFQEPQFEEILAYQTSPSSFRRWFGPLIQSSTESVIFLLLLLLIIVFDFFLIASHRPEAFAFAFWLKSVPLILIGGALFRLWRRHTHLKACLKNLEAFLGAASKAWSVIYRLKDNEIRAFAAMPQEEIQQYAFFQASKELRWEVITKAYFLP